ncbi:MAG TPA: hypothetical protein VK002_12790 [Rubricoccaceae bacterium]|nr:hypothetical protein [Rubricoccaceae bacterium]
MDARTITHAASAALHGPERKKLKVDGHHFNVKPAQVTEHAGVLTLIGTLSHHIRFRPDDQVSYRVRVRRGRIEEVHVEINRGGLAPLAGPVASAVGAYFGVTIPPEEAEGAFQKLGQATDGRWESAAQALIAGIALCLATNPPRRPRTPARASRPHVRDRRR